MSSKVSVISVGGAVQDVLITGQVFKAQDEDGVLVEEFKLGEKYEVDEVTFSTGGGATNGAVTFARQGLRSVFVGKIGHDPAGDAVLADLKQDRVDATNVVYSKDFNTGYSTILIAPSGERVVLTYRGASTHFDSNDFTVSKLHADWMFITSMSGNLDVIQKFIEHAKATHMKIALIPGKGELAQVDRLKEMAKGLSVFSANKEEIQTLVHGESIEELAVNMSRMIGGIAVVTDGPNGVATSDGVTACRAGMYEDVPVIDRLGAGDAFASGFVAALAKGGGMREGILLGSANSTSVVSFVGAKTGILNEDAELHDMEIHVWEV